MKNKLFIGLTITAVLFLSAFFSQTTNAESKVTNTIFETCKVKKNNANFFVTATEKDMKLKTGTQLSWTILDIHQGLIVVKAKVGKNGFKAKF
ncbi:MAG TPA: hypothetical protein PKY82_17940 [Pyrinomonadaceae bacterium]|nr:hypothetical protein [Pyrinomonadaceae bacterium]